MNQMDENIIKKKNIIGKIFNNQIFVSVFTCLLMVLIIIGSSYAILSDSESLTTTTVSAGNLEALVTSNFSKINVCNEDSGDTCSESYPFSVRNSGEYPIKYFEVKIIENAYSSSTFPLKGLMGAVVPVGTLINDSLYSNLGDTFGNLYYGENLGVNEQRDFVLYLKVDPNYLGEFINKSIDVSIEVILYQDLPVYYNVYHSGDGTFIPKTPVTERITNIIPKKEGFVFKGWSLEENGAVAFMPGDNYSFETGSELYAKYVSMNIMSNLNNFSAYKSTIEFINFVDSNDLPNYEDILDNPIHTADLTFENSGEVTGYLVDDYSMQHLLIVSEGETYLETGNYLFEGFTNLKMINFQNVNTSLVTNMIYMFKDCSSLLMLNLLKFNTENVINFQSMFDGCTSLTEIGLNSFDTSKATNMGYMFRRCSALTSLNLSSFDTSNVTSMDNMFGRCESLASLNLLNFNTSNVTNMGNMFANCFSLSDLNISNFDTTNVTNMGQMFSSCSALTSLSVSNFNTSSVTSMRMMFYGCKKLISLNLSNFNTSNVSNMENMFGDCKALTALDLNSFNTSSVTNMFMMFFGCTELTTLNLNSFDTTNVTNSDSMLENCTKMTTLRLGTNFNIQDDIYSSFNKTICDIYARNSSLYTYLDNNGWTPDVDLFTGL